MRPLLRQLLLLALTTPSTTQQQPQRYGVYVQSDSRAPSEVAPAKRNESWWWASAALTARQAARHGDRYVHYRVPPTGCVAADGLTELTAPWCKVLAMLQAMDDFPGAAVFLYLDSDAAVSPAYANRSLVALGDFVAARTPGFGDESRPVALSRDGHGHWCVTLWKRRKLLPHHWDACLNAGVIIWRRDVLGRARDFFERWWALAATCVELKSSTRLQCERNSTDGAVLFGRASRTR